jgi:hypothetical protein
MTPIRTFLPATALLAMLTCFFACSPPQEDKQAGAAIGTADSIPLATIDSNSIKGVLPVLWIEDTIFLKLNGKTAFRFYIDSNKDLTLTAWKTPYDNKPPVFTLKTSTLTSVKAGGGNYLGNLVLKADVLSEIKGRIRAEGWTTVKFVPILATGANETGQITYRIELTNDPMPPRPLDSKGPLYLLRDTSSVVQPGGYELNPSPPRNE